MIKVIFFSFFNDLNFLVVFEDMVKKFRNFFLEFSRFFLGCLIVKKYSVC